MNNPRADVPFTYEHYRALSASTDVRHELIDGDLYMVPAPSVVHQTVSKNIALRLEEHLRATRCGRMFYAPLDVVLGEGDKRSVVQPDIIFISNDRAGIIRADQIVGAPDLVVEILSPASAKRDRGIKKALYARSGVREYWLVDAEHRSIEAFLLGAKGYGSGGRFGSSDTLFSSVVPGFELALPDAFID